MPFPSPGDLPDPRIEPGSPALQADALPSESPGKSGILIALKSLPRHLHNPGIKPESLTLAGRFFTSEPPEKPKVVLDKLVLQDRNS